jgi:uncharacterized protein
MKVVIDTSVVVSAAIRDRDPEQVVKWVAERPDVEWCVSKPILDEYFAVLSRKKFGLPADLLGRWREIFESLTTTVVVAADIVFPRDQKDAKFIECALAANADYLITGDKDFAEARRILETTIISVQLFKRLFIESASANEPQ